MVTKDGKVIKCDVCKKEMIIPENIPIFKIIELNFKNTHERTCK